MLIRPVHAFTSFILIAVLALVSQAWGSTPELYEALGSPAGRYLLGELGAGRQITERWAAAAASARGVDPAEEILERVRLRYLEEQPGEAAAFWETHAGAPTLSLGQRARLRELLDQEARRFFEAQAPHPRDVYTVGREKFLTGLTSAKEQWLKSSRFVQARSREILDQVSNEAISRVARGDRATVVFDLDETGIDNRFGTAAMLLGKDGWANSAESAAFPRARQALRALRLGQFRVTAEDLFAVAGISDEQDALDSVNRYLQERISTPEKAMAFGAPYPGFVEYVRSLHDGGVRIVYLTGRPAGAQTRGTRELLRFFRLPLDENAELLLKSGDISTPQYKADAIESLITEQSARIVAIFDNEPENLFAMGAKVSGAKLIFVDTDFAKTPSESASGWYRLGRW